MDSLADAVSFARNPFRRRPVRGGDLPAGMQPSGELRQDVPRGFDEKLAATDKLAGEILWAPVDMFWDMMGSRTIGDLSQKPTIADVATSTNVAAGMAGGGNFARRPPNSLGMFGGIKARTADLRALQKAQKFEGKGASRTDIWDDTGWFKGPDGLWRFEIPDIGSYVRTTASGDIPFGPTMADTLAHPALYDAYPHMAKKPVIPFHHPGSLGGYDNATGEILLNPNYLKIPRTVRETITHEGQHGVQHFEGFARGGNHTPDFTPGSPQSQAYDELLATHNQYLAKNPQFVDYFNKLPPSKLTTEMRMKAIDNAYKRSYGENEAGNTTTRLDYDPFKRAREPWTTQKYPDGSTFVDMRPRSIP